MTHMERTMRLIEKWGWNNYWRVETYNSYSGRKTDLFNIIDILVVTRKLTIGVQACGGDFSPHKIKITEEEIVNTKIWLTPKHHRFYLIGWRKLLKAKGSQVKEFYPRIAQISYDKKADAVIFNEIKRGKEDAR